MFPCPFPPSSLVDDHVGGKTHNPGVFFIAWGIKHLWGKAENQTKGTQDVSGRSHCLPKYVVLSLLYNKYVINEKATIQMLSSCNPYNRLVGKLAFVSPKLQMEGIEVALVV